MKTILKKIIPKKIAKQSNLLRRKYKRSYSQSGEDMILNTILCDIKAGTYVDVGANNPIKQSNTQYFYEKGWNGINIDAIPGSMKHFNRMRPRDTNLEIPISDQEDRIKFYMFSSSFYNTFMEETANQTIKRHGHEFLIDIKELYTKKLAQVLDKYLNNCEIDFLTIDVEGMDYKVLKSNNWNKYRPKVVVFETKATQIKALESSEINKFLLQKGYVLYCFTPVNVFFIEKEYLKLRFGE